MHTHVLQIHYGTTRVSVLGCFARNSNFNHLIRFSFYDIGWAAAIYGNGASACEGSGTILLLFLGILKSAM